MAHLGQRGTPKGERPGEFSRKPSKSYQPQTDSWWLRPEMQDRATFAKFVTEREPGEWGPEARKVLSGSFIVGKIRD